MLTKLNSLLPVPIKQLLRGVLGPIIGFRVVADWRTAVQRSSGYESAETLGVFLKYPLQRTRPQRTFRR